MREKDVYKLNNIRVANVPVDEIDKIICVSSDVRRLETKNDMLLESPHRAERMVFDSFAAANAELRKKAESSKYTGREETYFVTCIWKSGFILPTAIKLDGMKAEKENLIEEEVSRSMMAAVGYLEPKGKTEEQIKNERERNAEDASMLRKALSSLGGIREEFERCIREYGKTIDMGNVTVGTVKTRTRG